MFEAVEAGLEDAFTLGANIGWRLTLGAELRFGGFIEEFEVVRVVPFAVLGFVIPCP